MYVRISWSLEPRADHQLIAKHTRLAKPGQPGLEKNSSVLATISNASGAYLEPILGGSVGDRLFSCVDLT